MVFAGEGAGLWCDAVTARITPQPKAIAQTFHLREINFVPGVILGLYVPHGLLRVGLSGELLQRPSDDGGHRRLRSPPYREERLRLSVRASVATAHSIFGRKLVQGLGFPGLTPEDIGEELALDAVLATFLKHVAHIVVGVVD